MGGIAGIVYPDAFQVTKLLDPMLKILGERGGGSLSQDAYKNLQMGCSSMPLVHNARKNLWIVLDGTIHNTEDLKKELRNTDRQFSGQESVPELILHAYEAWGIEGVHRLNGEYTFAIFDKGAEELFVVRDRMGRKPLYWYHDNDLFLFSSDIKALLVTGVVPQTPALGAIATYLFFGYFPQDITPIAGISKLLPGHFIHFHLNQNKTIQSYWSYSTFFAKETPLAPEAQAQHLDLLLKDSIRLRQPHGPASCFLGGGVGSGAIAYYLSNVTPKDTLKAFTMGFQDENPEDIIAATAMAKTLGMECQVTTVTPDDLFDDLGDILWHLGEPLADPYIVPVWRLSKAAARHGNTLYSGMGADELLAQHTRYILPEKELTLTERLAPLVRPHFKKLILPLIRAIWRSGALRFLKHYPTNPWQEEYLSENAVMSRNMLATAAPDLFHLFDPEIFLNKFYHLPRIASNIDASLYLDVKTRLADLYILQFETLTAANKVSWQTPLLDIEIIEFLASLPKDMFVQKPSTTLMRQILEGVFPSHVLARNKMPRRQLLQSWSQNKNVKKIFELLLSGTVVGNGTISKRWLQNLLSCPESTRVNPFQLIWSVLCLEIWFRLFIDNPVKKKPPGISTLELLS